MSKQVKKKKRKPKKTKVDKVEEKFSAWDSDFEGWQQIYPTKCPHCGK